MRYATRIRLAASAPHLPSRMTPSPLPADNALTIVIMDPLAAPSPARA